MDRITRKAQIRKAMELISWGYVYAKLKTKEDKAIYKELLHEIHSEQIRKANKTLKDAGIKL